MTIDIVAVFGSFLGTSNELGDLDVAVKSHYRDKGFDSHNYAHRSDRIFNCYLDLLYWPERELRLFLKARRRAIQLQDWPSFLRLAAENRHHFDYKVVFGSQEEVDAEIKADLELSDSISAA